MIDIKQVKMVKDAINYHKLKAVHYLSCADRARNEGNTEAVGLWMKLHDKRMRSAEQLIKLLPENERIEYGAAFHTI